MSLSGPILIIDDDKGDREIVKAVLEHLKIVNELIFFVNGKKALEYLKTTRDNPFIILCDVDMPGMGGLDFRKEIDDNVYLRKKSIPFVFRSGSASPAVVNKAYDLTVQGFFKKPMNFDELEHQLKLIIEYWKNCLHPNSFIK